MNYLLLIVGTVILVAIIYDFLFTTFSPNGAGIFTHGITEFFYKLFRGVCIKLNALKLFENAGLLIIIIVLVFWYSSVWVGASLVLASDPESLMNDATKSFASFTEKFYYTGITISTLGGGNYTPTSIVWQVFTVVLSFMGFALITTGISYMVPVLSAAVTKRTLATYIAVLGSNPQDILQRQWKEDGFHTLEEHFAQLTQMIIHHSQQLLAYPVIYCFYTYNPAKSAGLNIAKLDEVLTILLNNIPEENRPSKQSIYPLRKAISDYLIIQKEYFIDLKSSELLLPEMDQLRESGIPLMHQEDKLKEVFKELKGRRTVLGAIQQDQVRDFQDIYEDDPAYEL